LLSLNDRIQHKFLAIIGLSDPNEVTQIKLPLFAVAIMPLQLLKKC
jgi:hypothetical protein